jgi:SAM-dependent methyltransferase
MYEKKPSVPNPAGDPDPGRNPPGGSIHATPTEITVAQLMAQVRDGMAHRQTPPAEAGLSAPGYRGTKPLLDWEQMKATLDLAEKYGSNVGTTLPEMTSFRGLRRRLARFVGRVVLALARVVTGWQRQFNAAILDSQRDLTNGLCQLEQAVFRRLDELAELRLAGLEKVVAQLKTSQLAHERRTNLFLEEARARLPGPLAPEQLQMLAGEEGHNLDAMYVSFEDQFRGSREDIKQRLQVYLPLLKEAGIGGAEMPVLDIGCGRGEWLELLREEGMSARGMDLNHVLLEQCRQRGLAVAEGDALAYLRSLPGGSLGAVTGFHIIEHLPFDVLVKLLEETVRVLKPGGLVIFETPNPENILVGACTFRTDPTHNHPLYPPTLQFLAEHRGLVHVEILRLPRPQFVGPPLDPLPGDSPLAARINRLIEVINTHFTAAPDFALIGRKANG